MNKLINQQQPFGQVENHAMFRGDSGPAPHKNQMSSKTEVPNHGTNQAQSNADKAPGAYKTACKHSDNPFFWSGKPGK